MKYCGPLFMEKDKNNVWRISIGRFSWWVSFLPALYIWISSLGQDDIATGHLTVLMALTAYNFGKKLTSKTASNQDGPG